MLACELSVSQVDAPGQPPASQPFGPGTSAYTPSWLSPQEESTLLSFCMNEVHFQLYQMSRTKNKASGGWRYVAPKAEYYLTTEDGRRPVYYWGQAVEFYQAGQPMPPLLSEIAERLNAQFGLTGNDRLNSVLIICNDKGDEHEAPAHSDKHRSSRFFDISLGYAREMQLQDESKCVLARQRLASGSLLAISAEDNMQYKHAVPFDRTQPADQPRFSIVFRAITDHPKGEQAGEHLALVDAEAAARVQPGGDLWNEYIPLLRRATSVRSQACVEATERLLALCV